MREDESQVGMSVKDTVEVEVYQRKRRHGMRRMEVCQNRSKDTKRKVMLVFGNLYASALSLSLSSPFSLITPIVPNKIEH